MRSPTEIRNELAALAHAIHGTSVDDKGLAGVRLMHKSLIRRREQLLAELSAATESELLLVLDGPPVRQGTVDVSYLVRILAPVERTIAAVAQALEDMATRAGVISADIRERASLRLRGTFAGSFGLALTGPEEPPAVQLSMEDEPSPLFERAVDRLLNVIEAGQDPDAYEDAVLAQVSGLGSRAISHLTKLAEAVARPTGPVRLTWTTKSARARDVYLTSVVADRLQSVLTQLDSTLDEEPIQGRLVEASLVRRTFGIEVDDGHVVRGSVSPPVAHRIEDYFGKDVAGTVVVARTMSTVSGKHAEQYTLTDFAGPLGE